MMDPRDQNKEKEGTNKDDLHTMGIRDVCKGGGTQGGSAVDGWQGSKGQGERKKKDRMGVPLQVMPGTNHIDDVSHNND